MDVTGDFKPQDIFSVASTVIVITGGGSGKIDSLLLSKAPITNARSMQVLALLWQRLRPKPVP